MTIDEKTEPFCPVHTPSRWVSAGVFICACPGASTEGGEFRAVLACGHDRRVGPTYICTTCEGPPAKVVGYRRANATGEPAASELDLVGELQRWREMGGDLVRGAMLTALGRKADDFEDAVRKIAGKLIAAGQLSGGFRTYQDTAVRELCALAYGLVRDTGSEEAKAKVIEEAIDARDAEWQRRLAPLHEGFDGDGCESGDPIDWSVSALGQAQARLEDLRDDARAVARTFGNAEVRARLEESSGDTPYAKLSKLYTDSELAIREALPDGINASCPHFIHAAKAAAEYMRRMRTALHHIATGAAHPWCGIATGALGEKPVKPAEPDDTTVSTVVDRICTWMETAYAQNKHAREWAKAIRSREWQGAPAVDWEETPDPGRPHLINGEFQSDKYPTCPRGKVPLSTKDPTAQDLLWEYAQRRRAVDAEFAADLEIALKKHGYDPQAVRDRLADLVAAAHAYGRADLASKAKLLHAAAIFSGRVPDPVVDRPQDEPPTDKRGRRIVGAALLIPGGAVFSMQPPARHGDLFARAAEAGITKREERIEQGFLTNLGEFVSRKAALHIADRAGQLAGRTKTHPTDTLFSEDLW